MKARVVEVASASQFTDGKQRITIRVEDADAMYRDLRIINDADYRLDEEVEFSIARTGKAAGGGQ